MILLIAARGAICLVMCNIIYMIVQWPCKVAIIRCLIRVVNNFYKLIMRSQATLVNGCAVLPNVIFVLNIKQNILFTLKLYLQ